MLSITRHRVPADRAEQFADDAATALDVLRLRPGFVSGAVGRATDDADLWVLVTTWDDVGSFRRALSSWDVKVGVVPLLATALDEPTAFERLLVADEQGTRRRTSDRAADADWAGPEHG